VRNRQNTPYIILFPPRHWGYCGCYFNTYYFLWRPWESFL